jgi:hypothetical protein
MNLYESSFGIMRIFTVFPDFFKNSKILEIFLNLQKVLKFQIALKKFQKIVISSRRFLKVIAIINESDVPMTSSPAMALLPVIM